MKRGFALQTIGLLALSLGVAPLCKAAPRLVRTYSNTPLFQLAQRNVVRIELWNGPKLEKFGTGFVAKSDGTIVTNAHVLQDAMSKPYRVRVRFEQGPWTEDLTIGSCFEPNRLRKLDLCTIRITDPKMKISSALVVYNSLRLPTVGTRIFSFGHPQSLGMAVSQGILGQRVELPDSTTEYLQITSPVAPGSSGGPVLAETGEVVGIVTSHVRFENEPKMGIAISFRELTEFLDQPRAYLRPKFLQDRIARREIASPLRPSVDRSW